MAAVHFWRLWAGQGRSASSAPRAPAAGDRGAAGALAARLSAEIAAPNTGTADDYQAAGAGRPADRRSGDVTALRRHWTDAALWCHRRHRAGLLTASERWGGGGNWRWWCHTTAGSPPLSLSLCL